MATAQFHSILAANPVPVVGVGSAVGHALNDRDLRKRPAPAKPEKLTDGGGLYLHRLPSGVQTWRIKYRIGGRPDEVTIGRFPEVSLAEARADAGAIRRLVAAGTDPKSWAAQLADEAEAQAKHQAETFRALANAYFDARSAEWSSTHQRDVRRILDELIDGRTAPDKPKHAAIGDVPMRDLRKTHVREVLDAVAGRGALDYVRDVVTYCRQVVNFFNNGTDDPIADPTAGLHAILPKAEKKHHPALKPVEMPALLSSLRVARCEPETRLALRLLLLTGIRTTELRLGQWKEIDFDAKKWTVPAARMKGTKTRKAGGPPHEVPLSRQAIEVLRDLHSLSGHREVMFPGRRGSAECMSEGTMQALIKRMGYKGRMTGHGVRAVFSTWANDAGYDFSVMERALAHADKNAVRAAYDRGDRWRARVELMQAWADQLDAWEHGSNVVALRPGASAA